jgi:hypothetical protein
MKAILERLHQKITETHPDGETTSGAFITTAAELGAKDGWHQFPEAESVERIRQTTEREGHEKFDNPALRLAANQRRQAQCQADQQAMEARRHTHQQAVMARTLVLEPVVAQPISWVKATVNTVLVVGLTVVGLAAWGVTPTTLGVSSLLLGGALLLLNWPVAGSLLRNTWALLVHGHRTLCDQVASLFFKYRVNRLKRRLSVLQEQEIELNTQQAECALWIAQRTAWALSDYYLCRQSAEKAVRQNAETVLIKNDETVAAENTRHSQTDVMSLTTGAMTTNRQNGFAGYATDGLGKTTPPSAVEPSGASP